MVIICWRDDTVLAALVVAACNLAKVQIDSPPYAILAEVERSLGKALGRRTRNAIEPVCRALAQSGVDTKTWVSRAIASQHRMSAIASGDVSVVLADAFGLTPAVALAGMTRHAARALGLANRGTLDVGKRADLALWAVDCPAELAYRMGARPLVRRWLGGLKST